MCLSNFRVRVRVYCVRRQTNRKRNQLCAPAGAKRFALFGETLRDKHAIKQCQSLLTRPSVLKEQHFLAWHAKVYIYVDEGVEVYLLFCMYFFASQTQTLKQTNANFVRAFPATTTLITRFYSLYEVLGASSNGCPKCKFPEFQSAFFV